MEFIIKTGRLLLRPPLESDAKALFELMTDDKLTRFLTWSPHTTLETTIGVIKSLIGAQKNDKGYHWCVCIDGNVIGLVSLIDVKRNIRTWVLNRAELSYWIGSDFQGSGFATEASREVVKFGFRNLDLHKIIIAHVLENMESKSICHKLGFVQYAHEHDAFFKKNKWYDLIWYERINNYS
jgi:ribosomal-protein-alanine N-acetyltransferase